MFHRPAYRQSTVIPNSLPATKDGVLVQIAPEDLAGLEDDGFFLGGHGGLTELRKPRPLPFRGGACGMHVEKKVQRPPWCRAIALVGSASADPVEEFLGAPLHIEARILLGFLARKPRNPLHEIEDALCRANDYAEVCGESPCAATFLTWVCSG